MHTYIDDVKGEHEQTKQLLEQEKVDRLKAEILLKQTEQELEKEKEARAAVEDMIANYKEEVDTLNEALKIAAMDIAEIAEADEYESIDRASKPAAIVIGEDGSFVEEKREIDSGSRDG